MTGTPDIQTPVKDESGKLFERAREVIPGGVSSPVRAFTAVGGTPRFIARGEGPYIWDVDGNRYIDFVLSWGPLIHGHAFPPVVRAISNAAAAGTSFGAPTAAEVKLAEMVVTAAPGVEMVRFVSSGTEATMSAIRLARAVTGRDRIVKFAGNYHGHSDALLVQAGSGALTLGIPSSPGVPEATVRDTIVAPYNDLAALERVFEEHGAQIGAVIIELIAGNMGLVLPEPDFLQGVRDLTRRHGSLLIADEVITGFRVALGGAQQALGVQADLTTFGKILGGGLPIGAYGGRADIMRHVAPVGPVYQAGTLSGNPISTAAGIANLTPLMESEFYEHLASTTRLLSAGLQDAISSAGVSAQVNSQTGLLTLFFSEQPVHDLASAQRSDAALYGRFFHALLRRGIYLPPAQFEAWMLSPAHGEPLIAQTVDAVYQALREVAKSAG